MKLKKRGDFNFVLLFAIIAGAAILFLAIYGASKASNTSSYEGDTKLAKSFSIILGDFSTGISETDKIPPLKFNQEVRLENFCSEGGFGSNIISIATKSSIGDEWKSQGGEITIPHQYIFSSFQESKQFEIFAKSFNFPFKVADLVFITSEEICFDNPPSSIKKQIDLLQISNWRIDNCTGKEKKVCFQNSNSGCDIAVYDTCNGNCETPFEVGYVEKEGKKLYYLGNLIYGAILSEKDLYDCNVKRLLYRTSSLSELLSNKSALMDLKGCPTNLQEDLILWSLLTFESDSEGLITLKQYEISLDEKAKKERCKSW